MALDNFSIILAHSETRPPLKDGDTFGNGDFIYIQGDRGQSTASHLHFTSITGRDGNRDHYRSAWLDANASRRYKDGCQTFADNNPYNGKSYVITQGYSRYYDGTTVLHWAIDTDVTGSDNYPRVYWNIPDTKCTVLDSGVDDPYLGYYMIFYVESAPSYAKPTIDSLIATVDRRGIMTSSTAAHSDSKIKLSRLQLVITDNGITIGSISTNPNSAIGSLSTTNRLRAGIHNVVLTATATDTEGQVTSKTQSFNFEIIKKNDIMPLYLVDVIKGGYNGR